MLWRVTGSNASLSGGSDVSPKDEGGSLNYTDLSLSRAWQDWSITTHDVNAAA